MYSGRAPLREAISRPPPPALFSPADPAYWGRIMQSRRFAMTWSIVARDGESGALGIAIATRFFAVGSVCPFVAAGAGAVATQALVNPLYGVRGLELLTEGRPAAEVVAALTEADEARQSRQVHIIDTGGTNAAFTGSDCVDWAGHLVADGVSVAGNMLAGPLVVEETLEAYRSGAGLPFALRLISALDAGEAAGGDKRGRQSAALLIHGVDPYPLLDLRVDDHEAPLAELRRLHGVAQEHFVHYRKTMPGAANPAGIHDREALEAFIERSLAEAGAKSAGAKAI